MKTPPSKLQNKRFKIAITVRSDLDFACFILLRAIKPMMGEIIVGRPIIIPTIVKIFAANFIVFSPFILWGKLTISQKSNFVK